MPFIWKSDPVFSKMKVKKSFLITVTYLNIVRKLFSDMFYSHVFTCAIIIYYFHVIFQQRLTSFAENRSERNI